MSAVSAFSYGRRQTRAREHMRVASLDALLLTHPPNLRYLIGFTGTAGAVLLTPFGCTVIVDFRYVTAAHELAASHPDLSGLEVHCAEHSIDDAAASVIRARGLRRVGIESASMPVGRFSKLSAALAAGVPPDPVSTPTSALVLTERVVERIRAVKEPAEVAIIREAAARLSSVAAGVAGFVLAGRSEREIAADIDGALRQAGFERPAFETIVASGPNSALPHARPGLRRVEHGDGVVLDFGGVYDGYCVDLTRTVQLGSSRELSRLLDAVSQAHAAAIGAVKPGARPSEIDAAARDTLAGHGLAAAFGHGTGHGLGLEVHEEPRIGRLAPGQPDEPVESGMVFTIEPGAYVPSLGGVRIEDDVLVVPGGCEVLTDVPILL